MADGRHSGGGAFSADALLQAAYLVGDNAAFVVRFGERTILTCNPATTRIFGYTPEELRGEDTRILHVSDEAYERFGTESLRALGQGTAAYHGHFRMRRRGGETFPSEHYIQPILGDDGEPAAVLSIVRDLSEPQARALTANALAALDLKALATRLPGAVFQRVRTADGEERCPYIVGDLLERLGLDPDAVRADIGAWLERLHAADRAVLESEIQESHRNLTPIDLELRVSLAEGEQRWLRKISQPRRLDDGTTVWDGVLLDITDEKETEAQAHYLATHNPLTGLPNRAEFLQRLDQALHRLSDPVHTYVVAHLDVQRMAYINEHWGYAGGDEVLTGVAERLRAVARSGDLLGHPYSDVFLAALRLPSHEEPAVRQALFRLQAALEEPLELGDGSRLRVGVNIGAALYPEDGDDGDGLVRASNLALQRARRRRESAYAIYSRRFSERAVGELGREQALRTALERGELYPVFQAQVALADSRLVGFEALARWDAPEGPVSPGEFIPIAEAVGLVGALGELIMRKVAKQVAAWQAKGLDVPPVSVNCSPQQLIRPDFVERFHDTVLSQLCPGQVQIEITESTLMEDFETAKATMEALSAEGVSFSIDDFGTKFSSLSLLGELPLAWLKVDRSFVAAIETDPRRRAITEALVRVGDALGLYVVAEGVESERQAEILREMGCPGAQGFFFGRPEKAARAVRRLRAGGK